MADVKVIIDGNEYSEEELQKMIDKKHKRNAERQAHVYEDENLIE